ALVDQIVDAPRGFVLRIVKPVFFGDFAAPVAQQREGHSDFFRPGVIAEHAVHAYTQYLGVCSFQLCQVLLEVLHLLRSTTGESENIKRQRDVLLPAKVVQRNFLPLGVPKGEVRGQVSDLDARLGHGLLFLLPPKAGHGGEPAQNGHPERRDDKSSSHSFSPPRMFSRVSPPMVLAAGEITTTEATFRSSRMSVA